MYFMFLVTVFGACDRAPRQRCLTFLVTYKNASQIVLVIRIYPMYIFEYFAKKSIIHTYNTYHQYPAILSHFRGITLAYLGEMNPHVVLFHVFSRNTQQSS